MTNTDEEIAAHSPFLQAEDVNRSRFEALTFTARTGDAPLNQRLLNLEDGELMEGYDFFQRPIANSSTATFVAFGRTGVRSDLEFVARRDGNEIELQGTAKHGFGNRDVRGEEFNFNSGAGGSDQARTLEPLGLAQPFRVRHEREQDVNATVRRNHDGSLTLLRSRWGVVR